MALLSIKNRLLIANKQLLISSVSRLGLYGVFCNNSLLRRLDEQCRLLCFAYLIRLSDRNTICKNGVCFVGIRCNISMGREIDIQNKKMRYTL